MRHFEMNEWADFIRGIRSSHKAAMERHLASGCRKCNRTVGFLRKILSLAKVEAEYEPPRYAVASAKAAFVLQQPEKVYLIPAVVARLVYDSFRDPLPAGVRVRHRVNRHALYHAGDYNLDLHLQHERGTRSVTLIGQVASRKAPVEQMAGVPVYLVSGKKVVEKGTTNQFGEFQLHYKPDRQLRLYVPVTDRKRIEIQMSRFSARKPAGEATAKKKRVRVGRKSGTHRDH